MSKESDDIRALIRRTNELERSLRALSADTAKIPVRMSAGGGSGSGGARMWIKDTYYLLTQIPNLQEADLGYATTKHHMYARRSNVWRIVGQFEATTLQAPTPSNDGVQQGDLWHQLDTGMTVFYGIDGEWHSITHLVAP